MTADRPDPEFVATTGGILPAKQAHARSMVRVAIDASADPKTREGVMADALAYFATQQAQAAVAIAKAATIAEVKAAFAEQAKIGQVLLGLMAEGKLVFPYQAKGLDGAGILADLVRVSNGVSGALAQAQKSAAATLSASS